MAASAAVPATAAESYAVGVLRRSEFGYEWQDAAPGGCSGDGPWLVPKPDEGRCLLWVPPPEEPGLVRDMILLQNAEVERLRSAPLIRPPRGAALLRRFVELADREGICEFANRYGSLGGGPGESLDIWQQEITAVRDLARTLDDAARAVAFDTTHEPLSAHFSHQASVLPVVLVVYAYGGRELAFDPTIAQEHGYRAPEEITDMRAVKALARFARLCVQAAIERSLHGSHVGVRYDHERPAPQPPQVIPATLLGAIYLELDRKLRSTRPALPPGACEQCGREIQPSRRSRRFCNSTCRKGNWRLQGGRT